MKQNIKAALGYAAAFILLFVTEIIIGIYGLGIVRAYVGDVLIVMLLYCLIRIFTKALPRTLPLWMFGLGCAAEIMQYFHLSDLLGFERGSLPATLIGTSASWWDVVSYAIGAALIYAAMFVLHKLSEAPQKFRRISAVLCTIAAIIGLGVWWAQMAITYRFDFDPDWMTGRSLSAVQKRYVHYDAQVQRIERLEDQGYVFIGQDRYFHDSISSAGNFYYLYYAKCDENTIVTDVQIVDTGIGG